MKFALVILAGLMLASCASTQTLNVQTTQIALPAFTVPTPRAPSLTNVNFRVVTSDNFDAFAADFKKSGGSIYVLDNGQIKLLTGNITELKRYIADQQTAMVALQNELNRMSKAK